MWVLKCIPVVLNQTKNGVSASTASSMKRFASGRISSSMVSIRFLVSGPVSSMRPSAQLWITPRGPKRSRKWGKSSSVG